MSLGLGEKLSYVFLISVIIPCYEVVMRYVFNAPTTWVHDGATALSATGFLMAGCYCLQARRHIAITVIYDTVPQKVRNVLALANALSHGSCSAPTKAASTTFGAATMISRLRLSTWRHSNALR